jgi:hypothetical protein
MCGDRLPKKDPPIASKRNTHIGSLQISARKGFRVSVAIEDTDLFHGFTTEKHLLRAPRAEPWTWSECVGPVTRFLHDDC